MTELLDAVVEHAERIDDAIERLPADPVGAEEAGGSAVVEDESGGS